MNDLLGALRTPASENLQLAGNPGDGEIHIEVQRNNPIYDGDGDVEKGGPRRPPPRPTEQGQALRQFFTSVESIKTDMAEIRGLQRDLEQMHEKGKTIVKSRDMERHREDMQEAINQINMLARKVKSKVEEQDKDNQRARKVKGQGKGSANERTRTAITAGLKKKLKDLMGEFSELRRRIQDEYREVVERRVYTVTGEHVPEETIDKMIDQGHGEQIFERAIAEQGRGRILDTLAEVQERHRAMKNLEHSLLELHQIFLDMAVLVDAQGEMLDNIETQVNRSVDYVDKGTNFLQDAQQWQNKSRKLMLCCAIIIIIIIIIIVLAVVLPNVN